MDNLNSNPTPEPKNFRMVAACVTTRPSLFDRGVTTFLRMHYRDLLTGEEYFEEIPL